MVSLIVGPVLLILGVGLIVFFGEKATLECQRLGRGSINCTLTSVTPLKTQVRSLPNNQLQGADVHRDTSGDSTSYQVMLLTAEGAIPLTQSSSGPRGKRRLADRINDFLADQTQAEMTVVQDDRWFAFGLGGLFSIVGAALILSALGMLR